MKLPQIPPDSSQLWTRSPERMGEVLRLGSAEPGGQYVHWEELRRRTPPDGLSPEEWWFGVEISRKILAKDLTLKTSQGENFQFATTDTIQSLSHEIDRNASGALGVPDAITNKATQKRYLVSSLIEEALTSSQLEGAVATRAQAKEMIREGRNPRDKSESMVLNNYYAMEFIRQQKKAELDPAFVMELHRIITADTIEEGQAGRLRVESDNVTVVDHSDGTTLHVPPIADELEERLSLMCEFANGGGAGFIHPVVRSILLHFWLAYDHPFCDGNGRTARALFYWSMAKQGYWLTEYISLSSILRKAPVQYSRAFLYTETRPFDATYFAVHQLTAIRDSITQLHNYLAKKIAEVRTIEHQLRGRRELNNRQLALLAHALGNPGEIYTMTSHKTSHRVTHQTSRQDLLKLVDEGFLKKTKRGREYEFTAVENLNDVLECAKHT